MREPGANSGTLRCAASILTDHQCPILASDLRALANAMEATLEATEEMLQKMRQTGGKEQ